MFYNILSMYMMYIILVENRECSLNHNITNQQPTFFRGTVPFAPMINTYPSLSDGVRHTLHEGGVFTLRDKAIRILRGTLFHRVHQNWLTLRTTHMIVETEDPLARSGA